MIPLNPAGAKAPPTTFNVSASCSASSDESVASRPAAVGDRISVPSATPGFDASHVLTAGESLADIASRWGVSIDQLKVANPIYIFGNDPDRTLDGLRDISKAVEQGAESVVDTAKQIAQKGLVALNVAKDRLDETGKQLRTDNIDKPIDCMKPGDKLSLNGNGKVSVAIPGLNVGEAGFSLKGEGSVTVQVNAEDNGRYIVRREIGGTGGVKVGVSAGDGNEASASADVSGGGSVVEEYDATVYKKNPDGSDMRVNNKCVVDVEKTKARAKELTDLLVNPPANAEYAVAMISAQGPQRPVDLRTDTQKALMNECYRAIEFKGTFAQNVAGDLGLPTLVAESTNGKGQIDTSIRIEKADVPVLDANGRPTQDTQPGTRVTTLVSGSREMSIDGMLEVPNPATPFTKPTAIRETVSSEGKTSSKITLSTTFEYAGKNDLSPRDLAKLKDAEPQKTTASLSEETEINLGAGKGKGLDVYVAKGGAREVQRYGMTQTKTITIDDPLRNGAEVFKKAADGDIKDAARVAGDNSYLTIQTQAWEEKARVADDGLKIGEWADYSTRAESVERHPVYTTSIDKVSGTQIYNQAQRQLRDARDSQYRNPVIAKT